MRIVYQYRISERFDDMIEYGSLESDTRFCLGEGLDNCEYSVTFEQTSFMAMYEAFTVSFVVYI